MELKYYRLKDKDFFHTMPEPEIQDAPRHDSPIQDTHKAFKEDEDDPSD